MRTPGHAFNGNHIPWSLIPWSHLTQTATILGMPRTKPDRDPDPLLKAFGDRVRELRRELGYSQEAFGDLCGMDRSYMGGIERGEHNLALVNVFRIIHALELKPSAFFEALDSLGAGMG